MIIVNNPAYPQWVQARLGYAEPRDGDPKKNQFLQDDGYAETDPLKCRQSILNKGVQGRF